MPLSEAFNPPDLAQGLAAQGYQQMVAVAPQLNLTDEDLQPLGQFLFELIQIGAQLIIQEPSIQTPGDDIGIEMDDVLGHQCLGLFTQGLLHAILKSRQMGLPQEVMVSMVQSLAQDLFQQAKQLVAVTYGQDQTPDAQFSPDQQAAWMVQSADTGLMYYVGEYEKTNGPLEVPEDIAPQDPLPMPEAPLSLPTDLAAVQPQPEDLAGVPLAAPSPPPPVPPPARPSGPSPNDRYAAVALMLETLSPRTHAALLEPFGADEQALINRYRQHPERVAQELDLSCVQAHLERFHSLLKAPRGGQSKLPDWLLRCQAWVDAGAMAPMLARVQGERPEAQRLLRWVWATLDESDDLPADVLREAGGDPPSLTPALSQAILQWAHSPMEAAR